MQDLINGCCGWAGTDELYVTILKRREGYREAFHNFDVKKVAQMTSEDVERLMKFDGIIKNRLIWTAETVTTMFVLFFIALFT